MLDPMPSARVLSPLVALPTPLQWVEILVLLSIPVGLTVIVRKTRSIGWKGFLRTAGILVVPVIVVLAVNDVLTPMTSTLLICLVLAYLMAKIDTD